MNILVTGGCGFIGTRLCERLLELGHMVVNVDKLTYAANKERAYELDEHAHYQLVVEDVRNDAEVAKILHYYRCDAVMHLAAESHVDRSISGPQTFLEANVLGTYGVLEAVRAYLPTAPPRFRLVHVSTDEVFGDLPLHDLKYVFDENSRYNPSSPYSASKAAADHLVRAWGRTYGVPFVITYGANAYGPGQLPDKLVPMCITRGLLCRPITINGTGENVRSWLHVDDHVSGLIAVLERGQLGEAYCLASNEEASNFEIAKLVCNLLDELKPLQSLHQELITFTPDRPGNDLRYAMDEHSTYRRIGWKAERYLAEALRDTVLWHIKEEMK
jgi:dTDP-glucose 4,6-dehydratase